MPHLVSTHLPIILSLTDCMTMNIKNKIGLENKKREVPTPLAILLLLCIGSQMYISYQVVNDYKLIRYGKKTIAVIERVTHPKGGNYNHYYFYNDRGERYTGVYSGEGFHPSDTISIKYMKGNPDIHRALADLNNMRLKDGRKK